MRKNVNPIAVAKMFGITPTKSKRAFNDSVHRVVASNGKVYCLKRTPYSLAKLLWIDSTLQQVRKHGFSCIVWRNPAIKEGRKLYVRTGSKLYILMPWVEGKWPSPASLNEMRTCGVVMAKFHQAASKFRPSLKTGALNGIGTWPSLFQGFHANLRNYLDKAAKSGYSKAINRLLRNHRAELLKRSKDAMRILTTSNYEKACTSARRVRPICHGDGGPTNYIFNAKGVHLIDFETLRVDLPSYDLARLIYNSCKDHKWKFSIAKSILDGYRSVRPLHPDDIAFISVWLRFPRTTYLLLKGYGLYNSKAEVERQIGSAIAAERRITSFLKKLDQYGKSKSHSS